MEGQSSLVFPALPAAGGGSPRAPQLQNLAQEALERLRAGEERGGGDPDTSDDFQPVKKLRPSEESDQEGQSCSICFEPWTNSGSHRIASLKCGHLFGHNCIEKWLKSSLKCPQCNAKAKRGDIRMIFARAISGVDTTDRDQALREREEERGQRIQAQKSEAQALLQYQLARAECDQLKDELLLIRRQLDQYAASGAPVTAGAGEGMQTEGDTAACHTKQQGEYRLLKTIAVSQEGSGRVMAHCAHSRMLVASKRSSNSLMPGYGLTKLSTVELRYSEYVSVHSGIVRDAQFRPSGDGMLLTASVDRTAKLTSMHSNTVVQTFQAPVPVWACAWDSDDTNYFYCGLQNGRTLVCDVRVTSSHVTELTRPGGGGCPITSLSYVPLCRASSLNCGGLLMSTLDAGFFWEKNAPSEFTPHQLLSLPEGACTCMSFDESTRHCLASFRPSRRAPLSQHILCQLHSGSVDKPFSCKLVHQFSGGSTHKLLSRSRLFHRPGNDNHLLAAFCDEATKTVQLWDATTTLRLQELPLEGGGPALDLLPLLVGHEHCLAALTETQLHLFQWTTTQQQ